MVTFSRRLVPVKALEGDKAINAASQANTNVNQVAAPAGGAPQHYVRRTRGLGS